MDMTPGARISRAEAVVRSQRDPDGEFGAVGNPTHGPVPENACEGLYLQEIERLQRAVMGEPDPAA
jgi:hypothetical protein